MGYRSQVYLKTTTEGYLIIKRRNDSIENPEHRMLSYAESIKKTPTGFYRIDFDDIKWYESFEEVKQFMNSLELLQEQDIPFSFIRIGEDPGDVEHKANWTDDMPDEIYSFEPVVDVNDEDWSCYEDVIEKEEITHICGILYDLYKKYKDSEEIVKSLENMNKDKIITGEEYDYARLHLRELLNSWEREEA